MSPIVEFVGGQISLITFVAVQPSRSAKKNRLKLNRAKLRIRVGYGTQGSLT